MKVLQTSNSTFTVVWLYGSRLDDVIAWNSSIVAEHKSAVLEMPNTNGMPPVGFRWLTIDDNRVGGLIKSNGQ